MEEDGYFKDLDMVECDECGEEEYIDTAKTKGDLTSCVECYNFIHGAEEEDQES